MFIACTLQYRICWTLGQAISSPFFPPGHLACPWSTSLVYLLLSCFMFSRVFKPPTGKIAAISFLTHLYPLPLGKVCLHLLACKSSLVFTIPPCSITFGSIIWMFNLRCSGFSASQYAHFGSSILQSFRS